MRKYTHFDSPLTQADAETLVTDTERVARHSFWPLLGYRQRERSWKRTEWRSKSRPIAYAAHADSHIFAYYAHELSKLYEQRLKACGLDGCVLAYRPGAGVTNYHYAAAAFVDIASRDSCDAIGIDIERFFDTIPHRALKQQWKQLLGVDELPRDHYQVFRAATKFSVVPISQIRKILDLGKRRLRRARRIPLSPGEFRERIIDAGLANRNTSGVGIPQGLPISGLLANMVLFDCDLAMKHACESVGATYFRYSDDILLISPRNSGSALERVLAEQLSKLDLHFQDRKTVRRTFVHKEGKCVCLAGGGGQEVLGLMPYLGFEFDGTRVVLRHRTLTRYTKRMLRAVRRAKRSAKRHARKGEVPRIRRQKLYALFSHLGPRPEKPGSLRIGGPFHRYAKYSDAVMRNSGLQIEIQNQIMRQLRNQWKRLDKLIAQADAELRNEHS